MFEGKTALLNKLGQKKSFWSKNKEKMFISETISTVGFDIGEIQIGSRRLYFSDFAGQLEYVRTAPARSSCYSDRDGMFLFSDGRCLSPYLLPDPVLHVCSSCNLNFRLRSINTLF